MVIKRNHIECFSAINVDKNERLGLMYLLYVWLNAVGSRSDVILLTILIKMYYFELILLFSNHFLFSKYSVFSFYSDSKSVLIDPKNP